MALIICPNCKKQVSSTAEHCVHCGCSLTNTIINEERNYNNLNSNEVEVLHNEFNALNPEIAEYEKEAEVNVKCYTRYSRIATVMYIAGTLIVGVPLAFASSLAEKANSYLALITIFISLGCYVGLIVLGVVNLFCCRRLKKKIIENELIIMVKYKVWLKENKNIVYKITGIKDKYMDFINDLETDGVNNIEFRR